MAELGEFALIARYFARPGRERRGIGDDCALIDAGDCTLALTSDMLVEGVHFFPQSDARDLGHKALAVNLSDLAAAGARPRCFLLDLALPRADAGWLDAFSDGLFALARRHDCELVGGDTVRSGATGGPVMVAITAIGEVARGAWRGRDGARPGDDIWVSGALGEAALALAVRQRRRGAASVLPDGFDRAPPGLDAATWRRDLQHCDGRMDRPEPRLALGLALAGIATAAIDVSDGLIGDLGHILERSGVGACIDCARLPYGCVPPAIGAALRQRFALAGGDDYELLFTAPAARRAEVAGLASDALALSRIGAITAGSGLTLEGATAEASTLRAFDHFRA